MQLRLFPKHTGIWEGTYRRIDANGQLYNQWKSRLTIRMLPENRYHQVNEYFWDDGHHELHDFGICQFDERGHLIFDNPRITGESWESGNSVILVWSYKNRPASRLFEQIDLIGNDDHRIRVWKWAEGDEFQGVTMIEERQVAKEEDIDPAFWENLAERRFTGDSRSDH